MIIVNKAIDPDSLNCFVKIINRLNRRKYLLIGIIISAFFDGIKILSFAQFNKVFNREPWKQKLTISRISH